MASVIDICNLALARLGDDTTVSSINPPEGSMQAEHCQRFYPIARDSLLESHDWYFATKRATLARLHHEQAPSQFIVPGDVIRVVNVYQPNGEPVKAYKQESTSTGERVIYCDSEDVYIQYIARIEDSAKYSPLFVDALAWLLASHLAGPIVKGAEGIKLSQQCLMAYQTVLSHALVSDSNQQRIDIPHTPDWIVARG